ncbi:MAG: hypothetical protein ACREO3_10605 [Arenimonas sp.]
MLPFSLLLAFALSNAPTPPDDAPNVEHACAADAREHARALLVLHTGTDKPVLIEDTVEVLPSIANPVAHAQRLDVLQVHGYLYKSRYRFRLLYAQVPGSCLLMGQEVLELSRL